MAKNRSKNEKWYRQLKKSHVWALVIKFVLFSVLSALTLVTAGMIYISYLINSAISSEYESIKYMARLYEGGLATDDKNIYELLRQETRDYLITDSEGRVIFCKGEDTRGEKSGLVKLSSYDEEIMMYTDSESPYLFPSDGKIELDYPSYDNWLDSKGVDDHFDAVTSLDDVADYINIPIWISVDVGRDEHFIGKAYFDADRNDVRIMVGMIIAVGILIVIILFTMLIAGIKDVIRQQRMIALFFKDVTTDGHNWSYYVVKGEKMLRSGWATRGDFAVINMFFVNYRNYCICHSVGEGEKLLCSIYKTVEKSLQRNELVAHISSSNYALLLRYSGKDELENRLKDLIKKLSQIDTEHKLSFQMGIACVDKATDKNGRVVRRKYIDIDTEYNKALAARATLNATEGSGIAMFDEKMVEEQKWVDKVQERQQYALDNEEFKVYYQPKYDPKTNELRGAEALIRWDSKDLGFVSPGKFIPIFEKNGFITEIDHYMIKHVAEDQRAWLDKGFDCVPVSVNVSRAHFIENDLAEQICNMVDVAGTPHRYIEIELTESAFFDDKKAMLNTISKLKSMGFAVSMDDFGSGFSSLNSLKDMPLDVLKLDAEFFRGEAEDGRAEIVVSEAIKLGKNLNMKIVAEGIEVKEQVDFLAGEGCDMIQGYYFAKPMPGNEYEERMQKA